MFTPPLARTPGESDAFREHLLSSVWSGISAGIFLLGDVILAKTLNAPAWQITLLATLGPAANLFSFYWAGQIQGRRKAGAFLLGGLFGRLSLGFLLLWRSTTCLIAVTLLYNIATGLVITATNTLLQTRYPEDSRPVRFGFATSIASIASILAAQAAGYVLGLRETAYPWLFAISGITGLISTYHLFRMERTAEEPSGPMSWIRLGLQSLRSRLVPIPGDVKHPGLHDSLALARRIFRDNPEFVRFERDFMIYGFAFLSVLPILPIYIVRDLTMSYVQLSATKGLWALIGQVVLSPVLGIALGRLRPLRFTGRAFLLLALYPLCLLVSTLPGLAHPTRLLCVYAALFFFSIAMAGVNLSWTLGSMHFARNEEASGFQGLHVTLTGVRGLLAPSLGYLVYSLLGSGAVFAFSTLLFLAAGLLMLRHDTQDRRRRVAGSAPSPCS